MNKKVSLGSAIALIIVAVALTVSVTMVLAMRSFSSLISDVGQRQAMYDYIEEIDNSVRKYYTLDEEKLRSALAEGYVDGLGDPYTEYLTAEEYLAVQTRLAGNRTGFGIEIMVSAANQLVISHVDANSPAALSGVQKGDIITGMDSETMTGASFTAAQSKLASSEKLLISLLHDNTPTSSELTANTYTAMSVDGKLLEDTTIAYMAVDHFSTLTANQFKDTYNKLIQQGATSFVFDLRNNAGGSVEAVQEILDYLLPAGPYATCEQKSGKVVYSGTDTYEMTVATVTLVNANTVGEAELFAGALQDAGKTKLVGTSTEGKAVLQQYFPIKSDKAAVRLSLGVLSLIHSGTTWQDTGLFPDRMVDLSYEQSQRFELLTEAEDTQLQSALTILRTSNYVPPTAGSTVASGSTTAATSTSTTSTT